MTIEFDKNNYGFLLSALKPRAITDEEEYDRTLKSAEKLMACEKSGEQIVLLELLAVLIENYERVYHRMEPVSPHEMLKHLMEAKGIKQADLVGMVGSRGVVSEIVNGKRSISKGQAKALAVYFGVSVGLFI